jgi:hypothetical protein
VRRVLTLVSVVVLSFTLPVAAFAAATTGGEAPTGHDGTLTTIFFVALGIPLVLTVLTLIDIARGKYEHRQSDH